MATNTELMSDAPVIAAFGRGELDEAEYGEMLAMVADINFKKCIHLLNDATVLMSETPTNEKYAEYFEARRDGNDAALAALPADVGARYWKEIAEIRRLNVALLTA